MYIRVEYDRFSITINASNETFDINNEYGSLLAYGTYMDGITDQDEDACLPDWASEIIDALFRFKTSKHLFIEQVIPAITSCDCLYNTGFHISIDF